VEHYPGHHSILVVDIEKSRARADRIKPTIRATLYRVVKAAFRDAGIDWGRCTHEDRGDAVLVLIPGDVPKVLVVDHVLARLQTELSQHNRDATGPARIRVRVAVHAGEVSQDTEGWSSADLDLAFTLDGAPVLRRVLALSSNSAMAVILSRTIHETVIRKGYGPPDLAYAHPVDVDGQTAWIWVPGYRNPLGLTPTADDGPEPDQDPDPDAGTRAADGRPDGRTAGRQPAPAARSSDQSGGITAGSITAGRVVGGDHHEGRGSGG
jgi:class 3 adenylate cyclase